MQINICWVHFNCNYHLYICCVLCSVPTDKPKSSEPPPGLVIIPDFIDESLEQKIVDSIEWASPSEIGKEFIPICIYGFFFVHWTIPCN